MFLQDKNKDSFLKKTSEQIEDRVDEAIFEEAYEEYLKNGKKSRPVSELWKKQAFDIKFTICSGYNLTKNNRNYII